jgi:hypothetical protein
MTEYEKIELDLAIAAMDSDVSNDDLDLIFDGLTDKEIDKLQSEIKNEIINEANKLDWWSDSLIDQIDVISQMAADEIGKG